VAILPQVQAGIESPRHPGPGLISRREERITHFQGWLLERMGLGAAEVESPMKSQTEDAA
jgi:hypothetical protein